MTRNVDLLHGIPQAKFDGILAGLNASQKDCIETHCRNVSNGVNLIHGPFGSGKTVLVATLCELQATRVPGSKTFVGCSSNSACDAVVPKFANSELMIVRAHALSLERETLLEGYFSKQRSGKLREADPLPDDYVPPVRSQPAQRAINAEGAETIEAGPVEEEEDLVIDPADYHHEIDGGDQDHAEHSQEEQLGYDPDFELVSDDFFIRATLEVMKLCEERYQSRYEIFNPPDTRMQCLEVAIHTWILKFAGVIDSKWSTKPTPRGSCSG